MTASLLSLTSNTPFAKIVVLKDSIGQIAMGLPIKYVTNQERGEERLAKL